MRNKIVSIALVLLSPMIYYYLTLLFRINVTYQIIHFFGIRSIILVAIIILLIDSACAIITAVVTALPCSYLLGSNSIYITILLLITILGFPAFTFFMQSDSNNLVSIDFIGQCVSVLISVYYFANIGYRAAQNRGKTEARI